MKDACNCGLCGYPCGREGGYLGGHICEWCFKDLHRPERDIRAAVKPLPRQGNGKGNKR